jgi:hypothetical protein
MANTLGLRVFAKSFSYIGAKMHGLRVFKPPRPSPKRFVVERVCPLQKFGSQDCVNFVNQTGNSMFGGAHLDLRLHPQDCVNFVNQTGKSSFLNAAPLQYKPSLPRFPIRAQLH